MSQRAACQLERLGFTNVHDFVHGKAYWLASGRPTTHSHPIDRVIDHLNPNVITVSAHATVADAVDALTGADRAVVVSESNVVVGVARADRLSGAAPGSIVADIMSVGPTTIRPDEDAKAVRARMTQHGVSSLLITKPTGVLLGSINAERQTR